LNSPEKKTSLEVEIKKSADLKTKADDAKASDADKKAYTDQNAKVDTAQKDFKTFQLANFKI